MMPMGNKKKTISISIDNNLDDLLNAHSNDRGVSKSRFITESLKAVLLVDSLSGRETPEININLSEHDYRLLEMVAGMNGGGSMPAVATEFVRDGIRGTHPFMACAVDDHNKQVVVTGDKIFLRDAKEVAAEENG